MTLIRLTIRKRQPLVRRRHLVKHPVDAVPDLELVLERLEVDVRRLVPDRDHQRLLDETHDRIVAGGLHDHVEVE